MLDVDGMVDKFNSFEKECETNLTTAETLLGVKEVESLELAHGVVRDFVREKDGHICCAGCALLAENRQVRKKEKRENENCKITKMQNSRNQGTKLQQMHRDFFFFVSVANTEQHCIKTERIKTYYTHSH